MMPRPNRLRHKIYIKLTNVQKQLQVQVLTWVTSGFQKTPGSLGYWKLNPGSSSSLVCTCTLAQYGTVFVRYQRTVRYRTVPYRTIQYSTGNPYTVHQIFQHAIMVLHSTEGYRTVTYGTVRF